VRGAGKLAEQPGSGQSPVPRHGLYGNLEHLGGFLERKAAKLAEFHHSRFARIHCGERGKSVVPTSTPRALLPSSASSSGSCACPPPRLASRRLRAWSTRIRRIIWAQRAKKWARFRQRMPLHGGGTCTWSRVNGCGC